MSTLNGQSLFTGIASGLNSTYSVLANASTDGVTLKSILAAKNNTALNNSLNQTFASYIQENFSNLDTDKNGKLSSTELSNLTNMISTKGLTAAQLSQLGTATGMSTKTLEQVLEHFSTIDANHDGKVTTAEISAYNITASMEKKKTEFANKAADNMSVFYGSDTASSTTSLLDYKYGNGDDTTSSGES